MKRPLYDETEGRRDSIQLYADVIRVSDTPSKMTRIMRLSNVQFCIFKRVIRDLVEAGFLSESMDTVGSRDHATYEATRDGQKWAENVDTIYRAVGK